MTDTIHRFLFDEHGIRGELVKLEASAQRMLEGHNYPSPIIALLEQMSAVAVLLATTLKFEGKMSIQLQTNGDLRLATVQINNKLGYRALARFDESVQFNDRTFKDITQGGQLIITIEPKNGRRYQGIVPLDGDSLAECIEHYFSRSEQLQTRIWLFHSEQKVCGLLLQALPDILNEQAFEHLVYLADTLKTEEALTTESETLLHRLFHQEQVKLLSEEKVSFFCGCSESKMLDSLALMPADEIQQILTDKGYISTKCEFCYSQFRFDELAIKKHQQIGASKTRH